MVALDGYAGAGDSRPRTLDHYRYRLCIFAFQKSGSKGDLKHDDAEAEKFLEQGEFGKGSMAPKIKAALYFLAHYGKKVVITSIPTIEQAIEGQAGTVIMKPEDRQS